MLMSFVTQPSLARRLLLVTLIPLTVAFLTLIALLFLQLNRTMPTLIEQSTLDRVDARADEVGQWLQGYQRSLEALSKDGLLSISSQSLYLYVDWLESRYQEDAAVESLFYARADGSAITNEGARANIAERGYFQALLSDDGPDAVLSDPVVSLVSGEPTAVIGQVVRDIRGNRVAMLGMTLRMEALSKVVEALGLVEGSYGWVVDSSGLIVAHPDVGARMNINVLDASGEGYQGFEQYGQSFVDGVSGAGMVTSRDGTAMRVMWQPIPNTPNWTIGIAIPDQSFTQPVAELIAYVVALLLVALLTLAVLTGWLTHRSLLPLQHAAKAMENIARGEGDLTLRLESERRDEIGQIARQFNAFAQRMDSTLQTVRSRSQTALNEANSIAANAIELASRTEQSAANLQETSASMEQITVTVQHTSDNADQATKLSEIAASSSHEGSAAMGDVATAMRDIDASANKIGDIVTLIDGIAFQTNILALNASVEAARAGEHGRGFAVVAHEVRNLAQRAGVASADIRELIDESLTYTEQGAKHVGVAESKMATILENVQRVNDVIQDISASAREQSSGISQVNTAIFEMDTMTQQNASMVQSSADSAQTMRDQAQELNALINGFKLSASGESARDTSQGALPPASPVIVPTRMKREPAVASAHDDWESF